MEGENNKSTGVVDSSQSQSQMHVLGSRYSVIKYEIEDFIYGNPINMNTDFVADIDICVENQTQNRLQSYMQGNICTESNTQDWRFLFIRKWNNPQ